MRALIITNLFPNRVEPNRGVFNAQQFAALARHGDLTVVAPVPWFPKAAWLRRLAPKWSRCADVPALETVNGLTVHHPRYVVIPKIARALYGWCFFLGVQRTARRLHREAPCDVILATWAYPDVFGAALVARRLQRPLIAKVHGSDIHLAARTRLRRRMITWALRQSAAVVAVSEALKEALIRFGVEARRIVVIPNGVDRERFHAKDRREARRTLGLAPDGRRVVFVGNLEPVKGPDVLLEAMRRLPPEVSLSLVGDGTLREVLAGMARSAGLEDRVQFAGCRPHGEIPLWLCAADVVCLPSRSEGCPNALLEALACGRPVVATAVGAIPGLLSSGECGLVVPPQQPEALAEALATSLEEPWSPEQIRRAVLSSGWEESAARVAELLRTAGAATRSGQASSLTVLHVLDTSLPHLSGYAVRSQYIVESQQRLGLEPVVITSDAHEAAADREEINGMTYHRSRVSALLAPPALKQQVKRWLGWRTVRMLGDVRLIWRLYRDVLRLARERAVDVIHAHSPALCGVAAWAAARRLRLPFVYEVRALWEDAAVDQGKTTERSLRYWGTRLLETFVLRRADRVVVICEGLKWDVCLRGIPEERILVVPNGVDAQRFAPLERRPEVLERYGLNGHKVIGFIGSFFPFEGLMTLLEAAPLIRARDPDAAVMLVGGGLEEDALRQQIEARRLSSTVKLVGRVPHGEIQGLYSIMDVLVYPRVSKRITELVTPLKPLEAMAMGKVVVASDVGGLRELVQHDETGLLFRAGDAEGLAEACLRALRDEELAGRLGRQARAHVEAERGWDRFCERYVTMYEELVRQ